jgi:hypothetical protein
MHFGGPGNGVVSFLGRERHANIQRAEQRHQTISSRPDSASLRHFVVV